MFDGQFILTDAVWNRVYVCIGVGGVGLGNPVVLLLLLFILVYLPFSDYAFR